VSDAPILAHNLHNRLNQYDRRFGHQRAPVDAAYRGRLPRVFRVLHKEFPMRSAMFRAWNEEGGFLTFEWILLLTLLVIGIVSGLSAVRDAIIDELGDVAQAMLALDQSYTISFPLDIDVHTSDSTSASDSSFTDAFFFSHCGRTSNVGQGPIFDCGRQTPGPINPAS
jgi:hypothetical protein